MNNPDIILYYIGAYEVAWDYCLENNIAMPDPSPIMITARLVCHISNVNDNWWQAYSAGSSHSRSGKDRIHIAFQDSDWRSKISRVDNKYES